MAAKSLRTCPACGHMYEVPAGAGHPPCPKCRRANAPREQQTEPPQVYPGAAPRPAPTPVAGTPRPAAPAKPAVSQRPISTPKKSHFVRNVFGVLIGLVVAAVGLHFAGLLNLPKEVQEPIDNLKRKVETAVRQPKSDAPKEPDKQPEPPQEKPKPPDTQPPPPKPAPPDPMPDLSKDAPFEVVKVEDGATIIVKGETKNITVHFLGVGVAKPGDPPVHGLREGTETREWLKSQLPKGTRVHLYYGILDSPKWRAERDAFGSDRAWVFREKDGLFLNLELVKQGYAKAETRDAKEFEEVLQYWHEKARGR
ncbi:MAG: hypothetical protein IT452_07635 [Planctomycetia bacterium]|nr:hypothetical protein [Planctomycetia bacterium]